MIKALESVPGVQEDGVTIDFANMQATVPLDDEEEFAGNAALIAALEAVDGSNFSGSIVE